MTTPFGTVSLIPPAELPDGDGEAEATEAIDSEAADTVAESEALYVDICDSTDDSAEE